MKTFQINLSHEMLVDCLKESLLSHLKKEEIEDITLSCYRIKKYKDQPEKMGAKAIIKFK